MTEKEFSSLLDKYRDGKCTPKEKEWLSQFLKFRKTQNPVSTDIKFHVEDLENRLNAKIEGIENSKESLFSTNAKTNILVRAIENLWEKRLAYFFNPTLSFSLIGGIGALIILFLYFYPEVSSHFSTPIVWNTRKIPKGQTLHLTLEDKSEIWVNSNSTLKYPSRFTNGIREVYLIEGEAFFEVHHEKNRGFIVHTAQINTLDIGTAFNICYYPSSKHIRILVKSGEVKVNNAYAMNLSPSIQLKAKQGVDVENISLNSERTQGSKYHFIKKIEDEIGNWREGDLIFSKESFIDIAIRLENRFGVHIAFKRKINQKIMITAKFDRSNDLTSILKNLCMVRNLHYKIIKDNQYLIL